MKKYFIPILVLLIYLWLIAPVPFELATAVVPGWHLTVFPTSFFLGIAALLLLVLSLTGYWLYRYKADRISWLLFVIHMLLGVLVTIMIGVPYLSFPQMVTAPESTPWLLLHKKAMVMSVSGLLVGMIFAGVYFGRTLLQYKKRHLKP